MKFTIKSQKYNLTGKAEYDNNLLTLTFLHQEEEQKISKIVEDIDEEISFFEHEFIDFYIEKVLIPKQEQTRLNNWYIADIDRTIFNKKNVRIAIGYCINHRKLSDNTFLHSSKILSLYLDELKQEIIVESRNSIFHCSLNYCDFYQQDRAPYLIPFYKDIKEKHENSDTYPKIEEGNFLLVLSSDYPFLFHSAYCKLNKQDKPIHFKSDIHSGMFTDSVLIHKDRNDETDTEDLTFDLRFYPGFRNAEFYCEKTGNLPFYIQNVGSNPLTCTTQKGRITLEPSERKRI